MSRRDKIQAFHNGLIVGFSQIAIAASKNEGVTLSPEETKEMRDTMFPLIKWLQDEI